MIVSLLLKKKILSTYVCLLLKYQNRTKMSYIHPLPEIYFCNDFTMTGRNAVDGLSAWTAIKFRKVWKCWCLAGNFPYMCFCGSQDVWRWR